MAKQIKPIKKSTQPAPQARQAMPKVKTSEQPGQPGLLSRLTLNQKLCIFLVLVTMILNLNTLQNGYVMDDVMVIRDNTIVTKGFQSVIKLFTIPHMRGYLNLSNDTYRPLSLVMFAIEYGIWGANPAPGHFFNILFYAGCVVFFFLFIDKLFKGEKTALAFIAALLFAVHPIHTEVVANIKSRDEILCFFFALWAANLYANYMKTGKIAQLLWASLILYLSFISKETVISFPAVIAFTFFLYLNEDKKKAIYITASAVLVAILFLVVRHIILTEYHANVSNSINFVDNCLSKKDLPYISRLATAILILGYYLKLLFIPYPLICDHSYNSIPFTNFGNLGVLLSGVIYLAMLVFAIWALAKYRKNPWSFGILFFLFSIALFSNIFILIGSTMADRFMFFPSAGICLLMAAAADQWLIKRDESGVANKWIANQKLWLAVLPVALVYSMITYGRNEDWKTNLSLYKADISKAPDNTRLNYYYGCELQKTYPDETDPTLKKQIIDESVAALKKSLEIFPSNSDSHEELGVAYFRVNNYDSAVPEFYRTLSLNPRKVNASANLGTVYMNRKQYDSAIKYYNQTVKNDPGHALAWFNGAVCYSQVMKYDSAIYGFKKAIEIAPDFDEFKGFGYLAILYKSLGQPDSVAHYEQLAAKYTQKR